MIYGESQAGKTFLAIHLAQCVAYGLPFLGRKTKQGAVAYIAAEGGDSVLKRFDAAGAALRPAIQAANLARRAEGLPPLRTAQIHIIPEAPNLAPGGKPGSLVATIQDAVDEARADGESLSLVIGDTWHAMLGGAEENSAAETGEALRPLRELSEMEGLTTVLVHHPGKDLDRGARGSNALPAAMDSIMDLRVPGAEGLKSKSGALRRVTMVKVRDGEAGAAFAYRLPVVEIGRDEDGEPVTTCVVEPVFDEAATTDAPRLSGQARDLLAVLRSMATDGVANLNSVREAFDKTAKPDSKPSTVRMRWSRAVEILEKVMLIEVLYSQNQIQILPSP